MWYLEDTRVTWETIWANQQYSEAVAAGAEKLKNLIDEEILPFIGKESKRVGAPYGSWNLLGYWEHNPALSLTEEEQREHNHAIGYSTYPCRS